MVAPEIDQLPHSGPKDLGFGSVVGRENEKRLLNRDGTFNVERHGLPFLRSWSIYHKALTSSWERFLGIFALSYFALNALFAAAYMACGPNGLSGPPSTNLVGHYGKAFFFSVHTLSTIGYGNVSPVGFAANMVVTIESLTGLLGFALATGLVFARFSRPTGKFIFSDHAVVAPYRGISGFMLRVTNGRKSQMFELEASVVFSRLERDGETLRRRYDRLDLERSRLVFFPLSWTLVHPITELSPLRGMTYDDLAKCEAEFLVLLSGLDEAFNQPVHARTSYKPEEIVFGARFASMYNPMATDGVRSIDIRKLDELEPASI